MRRHTVKHRAKPRWRMPSMLTLHAGALKAKLPLRGSGTIALAGQFPDSGTHFTFGRGAVAEPPHTIRIDRLPLAGAQLPADLLDAFARQETHNPQLGLDWLRNLAQHALDPGDEAVLYTATAPTGERVCLPMREGRDRSAHALAEAAALAAARGREPHRRRRRQLDAPAGTATRDGACGHCLKTP